MSSSLSVEEGEEKNVNDRGDSMSKNRRGETGP